MINRTTKLRWRRQFRRSRRQVEDFSIQAEEQFEQHFFKRLSRLTSVRRFIVSWLLLIVLLTGGVIYQLVALGSHYLQSRPVAGGIYTEGIIGSFTNANPLYASGAVDSAVSRLLFSGLLKYDANGKLVGDLASRWSVDDQGTTYKINLRAGLKWHDGHPLTAEDVMFTYQTIQNPDAKSPLFSGWQGVKISTIDDRTIVFTLPNVLASFPYSLTNGIVPKHLLASTPVAQLRAVPFDTASPVGSGPFKWEAIEVSGDTPETRQEIIGLLPSAVYYDGVPKLQEFKIRTFRSEPAMLTSFKHKELTGMSGLSTMPDDLNSHTDVRDYTAPFMSEVGVFLRNSQAILSDAKVRQALVMAVDQSMLIRGMSYPVRPVHGPLMDFQLGYDKGLTQLSVNIDQAKKTLDEAGWKAGANGIRVKDGKPLAFQLYSQSTGEFAYVTQRLQGAWRAVGAKVDVTLQSDTELQGTIAHRSYDALVYGIAVGADPDVYAYWHSSQASALSSNRLNFSEYKSTVADKSLDAGRTRTDPALRATKYKPFLESWRNDAPALMLYQPRYLYVTNTKVYGLDMKLLNTSTDRYSNVQQWMIRQAKATN